MSFVAMPITSPVSNRGARSLLVAASFVIVIAGLREVKAIALPFLVAIFLAVLSSPFFAWLLRRRLPGFLAVTITVLANFAVLAAVLTLVGSSVTAFSDSIPVYQQRLEERALSMIEWLNARGISTEEFEWFEQSDASGVTAGEGENLPPPVHIGAIWDLLGSTLLGLASLLSSTLLIFLMLVFILLEAATIEGKLERAFGWREPEMARLAIAKTEIQRYLRIKTFVSLLTGTVVTTWVWILGVDFPLLWGLIAFLFNYIPTLGSILASIPPVLIVLIESGIGQAFLVGLGYVLVNLMFGSFLEPHLLGRRLGMSTLVVFLSLVFWGWLWGPVGMLLSVPLMMILRIYLENTSDFRWLAQLIAANPLPERRIDTTPL